MSALKLDASIQKLQHAALQARMQAYAPYSHFWVGAAVMLCDGSVFVGANVENASFGLTVCAERNAIAAAVAQGGAKAGDVATIFIVAGPGNAALSTVQFSVSHMDERSSQGKQEEASDPPLCPPCGACRQVLAEFMAPTADVWLGSMDGVRTERFVLAGLLPQAFVSER